ncbi:O-antigen ligase family protein [Nocardioides litoris]|uniref:O-antigen ligase family protein n=1 Tax=Nocardioides litoris TaxID=1926648 RepID=UPI00111F9CB3|nr:O-antigen ligase family protein [Nocardioides litoris]
MTRPDPVTTTALLRARTPAPTAPVLTAPPPPGVRARPPRRPSAVVTAAVAVVVGCGVGVVTTTAGTTAGPAAVVAPVVLVALVLVARRAPHLVVALGALSLPLGQVEAGPVELVQLVTLLAAVAVLVPAALRLDLRLPPWPVAGPLAAFVVLALAGTTRAPEAEVAFRLDVQLVLLVLLTCATTTAVRTPAQLRTVTVSLVAAGGVIAATALLDAGPTETYYGGSVVTGRALGIFAQPNELGIVSAVLAVLATGVALTADRPAVRRGGAVAALLLLGALGLSLSRGAWVGAVVGLVALAVLVPRARRPLGRATAVVAAVVGLLGLVGVGPAAEVVGRLGSLATTGDNPYDQRPIIWGQAFRLIQESPVLGQGPGGYTAAAAEGALPDGTFLEVEHAHNLLLNVAVEHGLPGLAALLCLVAGLAALVRTRTTATSDPLPRVLTAALVVVLGHGFFDYPLRNPTALTTTWLVLSLLAAALAGAARHRQEADA